MRRVERDESEEDERQEELEELEEAGIKVPDGKIGKKKLEKLQAKADKKLQREAEQREREENRKRREKIEEEEKKKREQEKEEEMAQEEEEKRLREEKERKEQEEYEKLKAAFSVEGEGCDAEDDGDEENKLLRFVNYIKETKVVMLEDLAAQFHLKTQEAIDLYFSQHHKVTSPENDTTAGISQIVAINERSVATMDESVLGGSPGRVTNSSLFCVLLLLVTFATQSKVCLTMFVSFY